MKKSNSILSVPIKLLMSPKVKNNLISELKHRGYDREEINKELDRISNVEFNRGIFLPYKSLFSELKRNWGGKYR